MIGAAVNKSGLAILDNQISSIKPQPVVTRVNAEDALVIFTYVIQNALRVRYISIL